MDKKKDIYRTVWSTLAVLFVLTLIEYFVAVEIANPAVWLVILSLLKAGIIVQNFMHVSRLWQKEGH